MSIKISISNHVGFAIKGILSDADGKQQDFDFNLIAKRLDEDELNAAQAGLVIDAAKTGNHIAITNKLVEITTNWSGVRDENDAQLAYSEDAMRALLKTHRGLSLLVWRTYIHESGVKEKN